MFNWFKKPSPETSNTKPCSATVAATNAPGKAEFSKNRGNVHLTHGRLADAEACYREAIEIDPGYAEAYNNLGLVFAQQGQEDEAIAMYRQAISLKPGLAQAHMNCGNAFRGKGLLADALMSFRTALALSPDLPEAHNNLGAALQAQGETAEALSCFQTAIRLDPGFAEAHYNLGDLLHDQARPGDALECFQRAVQLKPNFADAYNSLGIVCKELGRLDQARGCFEHALALRPDLARAENNLGALALDRGEQEVAYACFRKALQIDPDYAEAHSNFLFAAQYDSHYSLANLLAEHRQFGDRFEAPLRGRWPTHKNSREPSRRLRIGFVSGDLRSHPVGYFIENVLAHLDRHALDVALYPTQAKFDALSQRLQGLGLAWRPLFGLSDDQAARRITDDGIDILVDLSGHTAGNRLLVFARKPAPVQVSWLYFSSTGLSSIDYILCDRHVVPPHEAAYFVETPWILRDSYLCFTPPHDEVTVGHLAALDNGYVTFGCFNNLVKMNDAVVRLWARILQNIPNARLFLKAGQLDAPSIRQATRERFAAQDVDPNRLMLEGTSPRLEYLCRYQQVDVALDPFPFPGGTTTVEALWMGVPVLTRCGDRFISHAGESILHTAGLSDWIAADDDDYIAKAQRHAANICDLATLRGNLRARLLASPLCDAPRFARNLEMAFRGMWQAYVERSRLPQRM